MVSNTIHMKWSRTVEVLMLRVFSSYVKVT